MTIRNVPVSPPSVSDTDIRSGKPVRGNDQWLDMAQVANYLNGHEMSLVVANALTNATTDDVDGTWVGSYYFNTRLQVRRVLWAFVIRTDTIYSSGSSATVPLSVRGTIRIGTGTTYSFSVSGGEPKKIYILETRTQTETPYFQYVTITKTSGDYDISVAQVSAYQVRRYGLDPNAGTSEHAADVPSCKPKAVIKDKTGYSVDGVVDGIVEAKTNCRRASMFSWAAPHAAGILIGQGATWNTLFHAQPEVLARYVESGATVTAISIDILAAFGNDPSSANGYIRAVADSGDSATVAIPYLSGATVRNLSLNIKTEDLTDAKGRQSSTADRITFAVFGNGLAEDGEEYAVRLYSIQAGEPAP